MSVHPDQIPLFPPRDDPRPTPRRYWAQLWYTTTTTDGDPLALSVSGSGPIPREALVVCSALATAGDRPWGAVAFEVRREGPTGPLSWCWDVETCSKGDRLPFYVGWPHG